MTTRSKTNQPPPTHWLACAGPGCLHATEVIHGIPQPCADPACRYRDPRLDQPPQESEP